MQFNKSLGDLTSYFNFLSKGQKIMYIKKSYFMIFSIFLGLFGKGFSLDFFLTCGFDFFGPKNTNIPFFMISGNIKREQKIFLEFNGFL